MIKIYKSYGGFAMNVKLENGDSAFVSFRQVSACTAGGILKVKSKALAEALEKDEEFGKSYYLYKTIKEAGDAESVPAALQQRTEPAASGNTATQSQSTEPAASAPEDSDETPAEEDAVQAADEEQVMTEKTFACFEDARLWAHDTYSIPMKKLMSKAAVVKAGKMGGVNIIIEE